MRFVAFCLIFLIPVEALALSCMRPSVARSYQQLDAAAEAYVVVKGRVTLDVRKLPNSRGQTRRKLIRIDGRLVGKSMDARGFNVPFDQPVTLEMHCIGPWCGSIDNGQDVLAFVRRDAPGDYALAVGPCGGHVFANPKPSKLKTVLRCARGGVCRD